MGGEKLLTIGDVSAQLQVKIPTLRKWIFERRLPVIRLGQGKRALVRFRPSEIELWLKGQAMGAR